MLIRAIKTRILKPPHDDLFGAIRTSLRSVPERSVLAVTSKVVSIHQGRCLPIASVGARDALIKKEADWYLPRSRVAGKHAVLTLKRNVLIPTAGIDESNANGYCILWPKQIEKFAAALHRFVRRTYRVKKVGLLITDSHTVPLRRGVLGIALAYYGFAPLNDFRGKPDLFGRKLKMTTVNVADALAVAAVYAMGESKERTPLALITDIPSVKFIPGAYCPGNQDSRFSISRQEDLYGPLLNAIKWKKGHGN